MNGVLPWYLNPLFLAPTFGLLGVLIGALVTAGSSFILEQRREERERERERYQTAEKKHLMFAEKRLNALQNAIQLCDFVDAVRPSLSPFNKLSDEVQADWRRIRRENATHGALMPKSAQEEFKVVLRGMDLEAYPPDPPQHFVPKIPPTEKLRSLCLEAIHREYEKII